VGATTSFVATATTRYRRSSRASVYRGPSRLAWEDPTSTEARFAFANGSLRRFVDLRPGPTARYVLGVAALAGGYYLAAQAGYALQFTGSISAIWPPVGLAVAVLYLGGLRWWPGVVIGDLLSSEGGPLGTTIVITAANLAEVMVATILLWRLLGRRAQLDRLDQIGRMLVAIAPATAISATVGSITLLVEGTIHSDELAKIWRTIWVGDSAGALVLLPLILVWAPIRPSPWRAGRVVEATVMVAAVIGLSAIVLASPRPVSYLVFPALIWAAVRFGQRGATLAVFCAAGMAVWRTAHNVGPFVQHSITQSALSTQLYIAVAALTTLCLGAIVSERQRSAADLVESRRREVERASEERQRIARDLHDSVSQSLFSMTLHARTAERALKQTGQETDGPVGRELGQVGELSRTALAEMRALIFELRPGGLAEEGLVSALTKHAGAVSAREGLPIKVTGPSERLPIGADCEEHLYRLGQEALANASKHAQATQVTVAVTNDGKNVGFEVRDDGRGFDPAATYAGHLGLTTMRSRAGDIGAEIKIDSALECGTLVRVQLPITNTDALA
jgi:signal transduction histidine kinase